MIEYAPAPSTADQVDVFGVKEGLDFSTARVAWIERVHFLIRSTNADKVAILIVYLRLHAPSIPRALGQNRSLRSIDWIDES